MKTGTDERRTLQAHLYGEPVDALLARAQPLIGLGERELAEVVGISTLVLATLRSAERVRAGSAVAVARMTRLSALLTRLEAGEADPEDVPARLEEIRLTSPAQVPRARTVEFAGDDPTYTAITPTSLGYARRVVGSHVPVTPAYRWPLLEELSGTETWVKHENHTPTGAFKVRGGLNFVERLRVSGRTPAGLLSATTGNHGQSLAYAGRAAGLPVTIVVPEGNSPDKTAAMAGFGAEVVVHGHDFQEALEHSRELAQTRDLLPVPPFHPWLVEGVATYAAELHEQVHALDVVYVPVGMGSGICANIVVRDMFGQPTEVVGVVAENAPAYALSFEAGSVVATDSAATFVDGVAVRSPDPTALEVIRGGAARFVRVTEEAARGAMATHLRATHNLPEPAGSLALAGLLADVAAGTDLSGKRVALVQTGGNCDFSVLQRSF